MCVHMHVQMCTPISVNVHNVWCVCAYVYACPSVHVLVCVCGGRHACPCVSMHACVQCVCGEHIF